MSYYTQQNFHPQQNSQQKSFGIFFVIAIHIVLIWALANGLGSKITGVIFPPDPIQIKIVEPPIVEPVNKKDIDLADKTMTDNRKVDVPDIDIETAKSDSKILGDIVSPPHGETLTSSITRATIVKAPKPIYPSAAARLEESGTTGMKLLITAEGRVADAQVIQSSGSSRLDDAAIKHVMRNWVFTPCTENGKAVSCEQNMRLKWQLEDAKR